MLDPTVCWCEPFVAMDGTRSQKVHACSIGKANGRAIVKARDVARETGGIAKAMTRPADVNVRGGKLKLAFTPIKGDAAVSTIEVSR